MIDNIINLCKTLLRDTGKAQDGASVLLGKLVSISRLDFQITHMCDYFKWCIETIDTRDHRRDIFLVCGV